MKKNLLKKSTGLGLFAMLLAFLAVFGVMPAEAAYSTNITDILTDATTLFGTVQTLVVTITAFGIGLWVINKIRRR